jgi:hypothetical protein
LSLYSVKDRFLRQCHVFCRLEQNDYLISDACTNAFFIHFPSESIFKLLDSVTSHLARSGECGSKATHPSASTDAMTNRRDHAMRGAKIRLFDARRRQ